MWLMFKFVCWPLLIAAGGFFLLLASHRPELPTTCANAADVYRCVVNEAVQAKDPGLCDALDAGNDDGCMEEVYRSVDDPSVCDRVTHPGVKENCLHALTK